MKGTILDFSIQTNQGIISAEDGKRYQFSGSVWDAATSPQAGMYVEFEAQAAEIKKILPILQKAHQSRTHLLAGFYIVSTILAIIAGPAVIILPFGIYHVGFIETHSDHQSQAIALSVLLAVVVFIWVFGTMMFLRLIYKMWDAIQDGSPRTTPGKAVALLFVPVFNLYWFFEVTMGWVKDFNKYVSDVKVQIEPIDRKFHTWVASEIPVILIITPIFFKFIVFNFDIPYKVFGIYGHENEIAISGMLAIYAYSLLSFGIYIYNVCDRLNNLYKITQY